MQDMRSWESIQGTFRLVSCQNYEEFLRAVGCGPLSLNMVMRSASIMSIQRVGKTFLRDCLIMTCLTIYCLTKTILSYYDQTPDEHWRISSETAIKARSVTGYSTCNRKMILNKYLEGEARVGGWCHIYRIYLDNFSGRAAG